MSVISDADIECVRRRRIWVETVWVVGAPASVTMTRARDAATQRIIDTTKTTTVIMVVMMMMMPSKGVPPHFQLQKATKEANEGNAKSGNQLATYVYHTHVILLR